MLKNIFIKIELIIRWLIFAVVIIFLIEELGRVIWYVFTQWGILHTFVDGAVLYKFGEVLIFIPFIIIIHWIGTDKEAKLKGLIDKARWAIWLGGFLNFIAAFDLFGRVDWAWWTVVLMVAAIFLPVILKRWIRKKAKWRGRILATLLSFLFLFHYGISFLMSGYFIAPLPSSHPSPAETVQGKWRQDLHYLASELPRLHINAFHAISKEEFEKEVSRIDSEIPNLQPREIKIELRKLVALIGDGHTQFEWLSGFYSFSVPLQLYWLRDGLFVTGTTGKYQQILGTQVIGIESTPIEQAYEEICQLIPRECDGFLLDISATYLTNIDYLYNLGIVHNTDSVQFIFKTREEDTIALYLPGINKYMGRDFPYYLPEEEPLYRTKEDLEYWSKYFKELHTLYLKYNSFINPISFPKYSDKFWQMVEDSSVEYVIIDFRDNSGGASFCFDNFFNHIMTHDKINLKNHLYVLVNRGTFSSATLYAFQLRRETNALLAGEEMGNATNRFGDVRSFKLPNSGIRVSYCVKYFEEWPDSLPPFKIDIPIMPSSDEYLSGKDPILDSVLKRIEHTLESSVQDNTKNK